MSPFDKANALLAEVELANPTTAEQLEQFRIQYIGTKGALKDVFAEIKNIEKERKSEYGQLTNRIKTVAEEKFFALKAELEAAQDALIDIPDLSAPAEPFALGARHPVALVMNRIVEVFSRMGFTIADGPEIEDDWHNFSALNTPEEIGRAHV